MNGIEIARVRSAFSLPSYVAYLRGFLEQLGAHTAERRDDFSPAHFISI